VVDPAPSLDSPTENRRGPRTPEGKARSARNALRHGLRAARFYLLPHEDAEEFAALVDELRRVHAPRDPVELLYVDAIAVAIWRELRADRLEAETMSDLPPPEPERGFGSDLGNPGARACLATIVRYRAAAQAEHRRALALLREHRRQRAAEAAAGPGVTAEPTSSRRADGKLAPHPLAGSAGRPEPASRLEGSAEPDAPVIRAPEPSRAYVRESHRAALETRVRIRAEMARLAACRSDERGAPPVAAGGRSATAPPPLAATRAA
jgi:hypothetical protein